MKKILAILIALLAALSVQTVAFADGEVTEMEPTTTVSEDDETTKTLNAQNKDDQGLTYTLNNDGTATVSGCDRTVTSIKIPSNVESNGQTYTVTSIGNRAFANCHITSVDIPDSVISIDSYAFASCRSLTSVDIPDSVTSIGGYAFGGCSSLTEVTIPDSVTVIDNGTFIECTDLTSVDIPDSVTSIGDGAFSECRSLTSVDIPDGVTSIGDFAFSRCSGLTSVTIPGSVTSIGGRAFWDCDSLTRITFEGTVPENWGYYYSPFYDCDAVQTVYLSDDLTAEERAEWEEVLPDAYQIEYKDLTPDPEPTPDPDPTPDPMPTTPPADNTRAAEAASTPTVQQMESAERPDPQDVEATERYNFWMGVKADLRAAADGKTLRVYVPADYTNMPASVMEQIRLLDADVTIDLRWNGERLAITPETAQRKTALKAFWTFAQLCELYAQ